MSSTDILDLINSAVRDWETGPDAVRYNGPARVPSPRTCSSPYSLTDARLVIGDTEVPVTNLQIEADWPRPRPVALGMLGIAAEVERHMAALSQDERDEFVAYWQASPWSFEQAWRNWVTRRSMESMRVVFTAQIEPFITAMTSAAESLSLFFKSLVRKPCGARKCFCHSTPFPAARDYRRRTKHRNRRRR